MPNSTFAEDLLKNPDLGIYLSISEIPLFEIHDQILNNIQKNHLEKQGLSTLQDLSNYKNLSELATSTEIPLLTLQKLVSTIELLIRGSQHNTLKSQGKEKLKYQTVYQ